LELEDEVMLHFQQVFAESIMMTGKLIGDVGKLLVLEEEHA